MSENGNWTKPPPGAGKITLAGGGTVYLQVLAGQDAYLGSTQNGVTGNGYGAFTGSFAFP